MTDGESLGGLYHPELIPWILPISIATVIGFGVYATLEASWASKRHLSDSSSIGTLNSTAITFSDSNSNHENTVSVSPLTPGHLEEVGVLEQQRKDLEFFLSAKRSVPLTQIAWAFCSASLGAWVLFSPASFSVDREFGAGYIGLISYSVFSGVPIILIAFLGESIRIKYPQVLSLGDFALARFGSAVQIYVTAVVLFNMSIALAAEYTAIAGLFNALLGGYGYVPVIVVSAVTMIYTCLGGLSTSIITDQAQGIFSVLLLTIVTVYVAITFRPPSLPPLPPYLDANPTGWSSIITLGISFPASALFSDAMWQRVWASVDDRSLKIGATMGAFMTTCIVFLFGFGGFLATWAGLSYSSNTALFGLFTSAHPAMLIIVVIIAITMNESSVDSFQNALVDSVASLALTLGAHLSTSTARWIVVLINVPIMIVGLQGYRITALYLIANMITTTSIAPLMMGLHPAFDGWFDGVDVLFGCASSLLAVIVYGWIRTHDLLMGLYTYFYLIYDAPAFLIALGSSILLSVGFAWIRRNCGRARGHKPILNA